MEGEQGVTVQYYERKKSFLKMTAAVIFGTQMTAAVIFGKKMTAAVIFPCRFLFSHVDVFFTK